MKIDASRYRAFWECPDKFRIREMCKIQPVPPAKGTFAALLSTGRRRGTVFHELMDAAYRQVPEEQAIQELRDGGFSDGEIDTAREMVAVVRDRYPDEKYLAHEAVFEAPIPNSPHALVGRIDHILDTVDGVVVGDWKTSKYRSKRDIQLKGEDYCRGVQVGFYLIGARQLGFGECRRFLYRLVSSGNKGARPSVTEFRTERTTLELNELMRSVHQTCELIGWMKQTFGIVKPWPHVPTKFTDGYESLMGRSVFPDWIPDGWQEKQEHLSLAEIG